MLEEEEEPESVLEALERKRQREIEVYLKTYLFIILQISFFFLFLMFISLQEWRVKQIASGEAKDNANFQPLGGDWYGPTKTVKFNIH